MSQFIRKISLNIDKESDKDIDIISSTSRPFSTKSSDLIECIEESGSPNKSNSPAPTPAPAPSPSSSSSSILSRPKVHLPSSEHFHTIKIDQYQGSPLPRHMYENFTFSPTTLKADQQHVNAEEALSPELTNQSFQSAFDTYNPPPTTTELTDTGAYELKTQENYQEEQGDEAAEEEAAAEEEMNTHLIPAATANQINPVVTMTILTRLWKFFKYLTNLQPQRGRNDNTERQPLLPSPNLPSSQPIGSPGCDNGDDLEGQPPPQGPAYNLLTRYRWVFIVLTIIAAVTILAVVLATGDSKLLLVILKALLCYLLGSSAQKLLGQDFCPVAN